MLVFLPGSMEFPLTAARHWKKRPGWACHWLCVCPSPKELGPGSSLPSTGGTPEEL